MSQILDMTDNWISAKIPYFSKIFYIYIIYKSRFLFNIHQSCIFNHFGINSYNIHAENPILKTQASTGLMLMLRLATLIRRRLTYLKRNSSLSMDYILMNRSLLGVKQFLNVNQFIWNIFYFFIVFFLSK